MTALLIALAILATYALGAALERWTPDAAAELFPVPDDVQAWRDQRAAEAALDPETGP